MASPSSGAQKQGTQTVVDSETEALLHMLKVDARGFSRHLEWLGPRGPVRLCGVDLRGVDLRPSAPWPLDLTGADVRGARIDADHLVACRLLDVDLGGFVTDAPIDAARMAQRLQAGGRLTDTDRGVRLQYADLRGIDLRGADLRGVRWRSCALQHADLRDACLDDAGLNGAELYAAKLDGAHGVHVDLSGANLRGCDVGALRLELSDLSWADLAGCDLRRTVWTRCVLVGANLRGAKRKGAAHVGLVEGPGR